MNSLVKVAGLISSYLNTPVNPEAYRGKPHTYVPLRKTGPLVRHNHLISALQPNHVDYSTLGGSSRALPQWVKDDPRLRELRSARNAGAAPYIAAGVDLFGTMTGLGSLTPGWNSQVPKAFKPGAQPKSLLDQYGFTEYISRISGKPYSPTRTYL